MSECACTAICCVFVLQVRGPEEAYLGDLGPVLRATVDDTILFHFQNRLAYPVSVHAHGVFYNKSSEGALYADGTSGAAYANFVCTFRVLTWESLSAYQPSGCCHPTLCCAGACSIFSAVSQKQPSCKMHVPYLAARVWGMGEAQAGQNVSRWQAPTRRTTA